MYRNETENVEVYFICYKKEEMSLVETYYDEILDIHYWYFNAYLAYKEWKKRFIGLHFSKLTKDILTIAASRYLMYLLENQDFKNEKEHERILKDLNIMKSKLEKIIKNNDFNIFLD